MFYVSLPVYIIFNPPPPQELLRKCYKVGDWDKVWFSLIGAQNVTWEDAERVLASRTLWEREN